jgi:hypothetical protein
VAPTLLDEGRGRHLRGEDLFDARLREVDEGWEPRLPSRSEGEAEQFLVLIVGPSRRPRHPLVGQLAADADRLPDIEHILLLADGLRATWVPLAPAVEDKDGHAPTRQQERGGRAHRPVPDNDDRLSVVGRQGGHGVLLGSGAGSTWDGTTMSVTTARAAASVVAARCWGFNHQGNTAVGAPEGGGTTPRLHPMASL